MIIREDFIASVMQTALWACQGIWRGITQENELRQIEQLKKNISIMDSIEKVTPEEYYNTKHQDESGIKFDRLPLYKRKYVILEVCIYLKARDLYYEIHSTLSQ